MSAGSLFDSETNNSSSRNFFLIIIVVLVAVSASVYTLYQFSKSKQKTQQEKIAEEVRDVTVLMPAQPTFSGKDFSQQILGKGKLQRFIWDKKEAYFSFPQASEQ